MLTRANFFSIDLLFILFFYCVLNQSKLLDKVMVMVKLSFFNCFLKFIYQKKFYTAHKVLSENAM